MSMKKLFEKYELEESISGEDRESMMGMAQGVALQIAQAGMEKKMVELYKSGNMEEYNSILKKAMEQWIRKSEKMSHMMANDKGFRDKILNLAKSKR